MKSIVTWASVVASILAAFLWLGSTLVKVDAEAHANKVEKEQGFKPAQITVINGGKGSDFVMTAILQAKWNRWAAAMTGVAALLQGWSNSLP